VYPISGHFHTRALIHAISEIGADRVVFYVDYSYEYNESGVRWFDNVALSDNNKRKIGRDNACRLFRLS
jgi:2,3-dihydroxybenzoate decarboxylase